ncbi:hypothetical protein AAJP47_08930 [Psychrobacter sp. B38]|uniref:hypothetical protein n=1 Tax=Psychrobacter sp. B38 TaxID=3143538 RepID=UPI00320F8037
MKSNTFNYSLLAIGVAAVMGISSGAMAATPIGGTSGTFNVKNKASATYTVAGNNTEQRADSNEVMVSVSETGSFGLLSTVEDGNSNDDFGRDRPINAQAKSTVNFTHTLINAGNMNDSYTVNIANATGDDFDYNLSSSVIQYQKVSASGSNIGSSTTISNGGTIPLAPGEKAFITITAQSDTKRVADANGILLVTAESAYLKSKNSASTAYTATNTDNAKTTAPIYAITNSAQTNLGNKNLDLNNAGAYVDYTIKVKNDGNINGTAIVISDDLPAGLVAILSTEANYTAPTTTASNGSAAVTPVITNNGKTITVTGQNVQVGETITVTFRAKKAAGATDTSVFTNYAVVKDNTKSDTTTTTPDITDSSGDSTDKSVTESTYEDPARPNLGKDDNTGATLLLKNQTRNLTVTTGTNQEVAPKNDNVSYSYTITNAGKDITEAAKTGEVLFTVAPTAATDKSYITVERVYVDVNNNGAFDGGDIELTPNAAGKYDLNQAKTTGIAPNESVKISVQVKIDGTSDNSGTNNLGEFETMAITVVQQGSINGTPKQATDATTTSTTTLRGINLLKSQIVADCTTTVASITDNDSRWSQAATTAQAGQCVFYKLEATNTFTTTSGISLNNVVVLDTLDTKVEYRTDFTSTPSAGNGTIAPVVKGTFASLAPQAKGVIKFSAKTSQASSATW